MIRLVLCLLLTIMICVANLTQIFGQISNVEYGKNRIQFHDDFDTWYRYETGHFITHWYGKSRTISDFVIKMAEYDFEDLENILEHHINDKIDILVYTDLTDLKQSNIGSEEAFVNENFRTKVDGRKMFVYFDGDHKHLRKQVREGITEVYLNDMIHGGNLQQIVQNAVSSDLPLWYRDGFISYMGDTWSPRLESNLFDLFNYRKPKDFKELERHNHVLAGHVVWYYLASQYGHRAISNLLYVTRLNRDLNENFIYILGKSFDEIKNDAFKHIKKQILSDKGNEKQRALKGDIEIKNNKKAKITSIKSNPTRNSIAYVLNDLGKTHIIIENLDSGDRTIVFKNSYRNIIQATDLNYPLMSWSDDGEYLFVIYEYRDIIYLKRINSIDNSIIEEPLSPEYGRVYSLDYVSDNGLLISASVESKIDLFMYFPNNRNSNQLTSDIFDNIDATYVQIKSEKGVLYSSNKPPDFEELEASALTRLLPLASYSIYFKSLDDGTEYAMVRSKDGVSYRKPIGMDSSQIAYLTDETGVINKKIAVFNKVFVGNYQEVKLKNGIIKTIKNDLEYSEIEKDSIDTVNFIPENKYVHNSRFISDRVYKLIGHDYNSHTNTFYDIITFSNIDRIAKYGYDIELAIGPKKRWYTSATGAVNIDDTSKANIEADTVLKIIPPSYLFQSEYPDPATVIHRKSEIQKELFLNIENENVADKDLEIINFSRILGSRLTFHVADVDFDFNNELLFDGLQNFTSSDNGDIINQPFDILLKMNLRDRLENYRFEAGVRFPTDFRGSEYFVVFDDNKKRIDKRYAFYRKANTELGLDRSNFEFRFKRVSNIALTRWKYPFDIYRSVRATFTFRQDNSFLLISEGNTLVGDDNPTQRFGLKLEYVFDNSLQWDYNIIHGTRYKFYAEAINRSVITLFDDWEFKPHEGFMTILGLDVRHYQRLDTRIVLALRLAGATSFGSEKVLYYLGGVDNWLFPNRNEVIPVSPNQNFVYQSLGVQMRGFDQNIRNGQSFAVFNGELRIPIFQYLKKDRLRSSFLRNILITGFFDVGTAWVGTLPFGEDNPVNIITVSNPRSSIRVNFFRDALVYGFGGGLRTYLLGYNLRLDYAWGVDSGVRQDGKLYFSIGKDF